jgi:hypothetical protein
MQFVNELKYKRAVGLSTTKDPQDIKEIYLKIGGLIVGDDTVVEPTEAVTEVENNNEVTGDNEMFNIDLNSETNEDVIEKVKRGRPSKHV